MKREPDETVRHPEVEVPLTGQDGNVFMIVGRVGRALRRAGVDDSEIADFRAEIVASEDYEAALRVVQRWVTVA